LQETVNALFKEGEEKTQKAVALTKSQTQKQIQQLMDDLHFHELEGAEKQASYGKLQREKISLQNELEKIYQEGPVEVTKAGLSLDELQKKLSKVELNRDECLLQIDILQMSLRRYKSRLENDKSAYVNQLNELRKQTKAIKNDFDEVSESRLKLVNEVNSLKKELNSRREDNVTMDTTYASQLSSLQQTLELKEKEHGTRLQAVENTNKDAMNELREMLLTQQKNANKWRDESRTLCQKLERTINKLTQDNNALKRKNAEVIQVHNDDVNRIDELEKEILTNQATIDKLKTLYAALEERANTAEDQLQIHISRGKQLEKERQTLSGQIDRLKLEISRPVRAHAFDQQWDNYLEGFS
jgi:chromosome segregation ATPase